MSGTHRVAALLEARYGVRAEQVEPVAEGTETLNVRVRLAGGGRVFVKQYPNGADTAAVSDSLAFAAHCADHGVRTPALWVDDNGEGLTWYSGTVWCVMDDITARPALGPLTVRQGEAIGTALGHLHRLGGGYRGSLRPASTAWRDADGTAAAACCDALLTSLRDTPGQVAAVRREQLEQRRHDLLACSSLRGAWPSLWSEQPLHGDATRPNLLFDNDNTVWFIDFRAVSGPAVWELAKVAFDPLTVAHGQGWIGTGVAMIGAYRQEHPGIPAEELLATARVALMYRMFSTYGATNDERLPPETAAAVGRYWDDKHVTVQRLHQHLDDIEEQLRHLTTGT